VLQEFTIRREQPVCSLLYHYNACQSVYRTLAYLALCECKLGVYSVSPNVRQSCHQTI